MPIAVSIGAIVSILAVTFAGQNLAPMTARLSTVPPGEVGIDLIVANGTGCPASTVGISISPGNDAFSITYRAFHAQVGVGATPTDVRKNCQINLRMRIPQGYSYAITGVDHRGSAHLEAGANGIQRTRYYYAGQIPSTPMTHQFSGPFDDAWQATDNIPVESLIFSPCGVERNLNINSELRVSAGTSDTTVTNSSMTMDSTTSNIYRFAWRECTD